jgi:hypothetical protein
MLVASALLLIAAGFAFRSHYLGWFGSAIPNVAAWGNDWQAWLDQQAIEHPAMVHLMPPDCLCRFFTATHASDLSEQARVMGYTVYQAGDSFLKDSLAVSLQTGSFPASPGPLLGLTDTDGLIRYLGPYSDGLTCTSATSLVDDWLPLARPGHVLQVDANSCQCAGFANTPTFDE